LDRLTGFGGLLEGDAKEKDLAHALLARAQEVVFFFFINLKPLKK